MVRPSTLEKIAATSVAESTSGPVGQYVFPTCAAGDAAIRALELEVTNPVPSGTPVAARDGHGIVGMRERAVLLGGTLDASVADGVFRVRAVLPYRDSV